MFSAEFLLSRKINLFGHTPAPSPLADPELAGCAEPGQVQKIACWSFSLKQLFKPKKQNQ
jgi:hypothetical protein